MAEGELSSVQPALSSGSDVVSEAPRSAFTGRDLLLVGTVLAAIAITACIGVLGWDNGWSLFGVERGNNDLVVFFLMALALRVGRYNGRAGTWTLFVASILKIYPAFALGYCFRMPRHRLLKVGGILLLALTAYAAVNFDDLRAMRSVTETSYGLSYGVETTALWIEELEQSPVGNLRGWLGGGALLVLVFAFLVSGIRPAWDERSPYLDAFRIGAGVFLATFVLMSNWDYRLVFLFFTVPQLVVWTFASNRAEDIRFTSLMSLVLVMLVVWRTGTAPGPHLKLVWLLYACLAYLYARSLPEYVLRLRAKPVPIWERHR